jgi:hypothetical protein
MKDGLDKTVEQLNEQRRQETEEAEKTGADILLINKKYDKLVIDAFNEHNAELAKIAAEAEAARLKALEEAAKLRERGILDTIEAERMTALISIDRTQKDGETEKEYKKRLAEEIKQITITSLQAQLDYFQSTQKLTEDNQKAIADLILKIKELKAEVSTPETEEGWLNKLLGLNDKELKILTKNLRIIVDSVTDAMQDLNDIQQAQLDKKIKRLDDERNAVEKSIDEQRELNDEGLANNLNAELGQLAAIEEQQRVAFERHKELERQKQNIAAVTQATNLITGASTILATEAINPFLAAATIAAMFAAFIAAQAKSRQLINSEEQGFAEGGYTGDGEKHDVAGTVHRSEFVMDKESTGKHRDLFEAIHNHEPIPYHALNELLRDTGVTMPNLPTKVFHQGNAAIRQQNMVITKDPELLAELKKNTAVNEKVLAKMDNETFINGNETIEKKGNHTITTRKR